MLEKAIRTLKVQGVSGLGKAVAMKMKRVALLPVSHAILRSSYGSKMLSKWQLPEERNWLDNMFFDNVAHLWFKKEYWSEVDPDKRLKKQNLLMGGNSGAAWARHYNNISFDPDGMPTIGELTFSEASIALIWLESHLAERHQAIVYQVGSSSGREVAYYAKKFSQHQFFGTDLYPEVIEYSSRTHRNKNLEFFEASALSLIDQLKIESSPLVIFSSGTLQYVQPEHLHTFFESFAKIKLPVDIFIHEPANEIPTSPFDLNSSHPRGNFSWTHNYRDLALKAGLKVIRAEVVRPYCPYDKYPNHLGTVHCELHLSNII